MLWWSIPSGPQRGDHLHSTGSGHSWGRHPVALAAITRHLRQLSYLPCTVSVKDSMNQQLCCNGIIRHHLKNNLGGVPISSYWPPQGGPIGSYCHPPGGANKHFLPKNALFFNNGRMFTLDMILLFKQCCTIPLGIPLASPQLIENIPENNSLLCHIYHAENVTFYEYNLLSKSICERGQ